MSESRTRRLAVVALAAIAIVMMTGVLFAHDFWIVPDAFQVAAGGAVTIRGQTSTKFPTSQGAVAPERVAEARLVGASSDETLTDLSTSGKSLLIRHRPTSPGQRIVGVALVSRTTRTTPAGLKRYIALEGAPQLAERYDREGGSSRRPTALPKSPRSSPRPSWRSAATARAPSPPWSATRSSWCR